MDLNAPIEPGLHWIIMVTMFIMLAIVSLCIYLTIEERVSRWLKDAPEPDAED